MQVAGGSTDVTTYFVMRKTSDGTAATGLTPADFDLSYVRTRETPSAKVDASALVATDSTHADNKVIEVDATNQPGKYRIDWPDAAFVAGVREAILTAKVATAFTENLRVEIDAEVTTEALGTQAKADVQGEADTALASYGGPTNAEMEARTLVAAAYFDPAADTVDLGKWRGSVPAVLFGNNVPANMLMISNNANAASFLGQWIAEGKSAGADSGSTTTLVDAALIQADNYWRGSLLIFTGGANSGYTANISGFDAATDTLTFDPAVPTVVTTESYILIPGLGWTVSGSAPSVDEIADQVWEEAQGDHVAAGSFGEIASEIAAIPTTVMRGTDFANTTTPPTVGAIADQVWNEEQVDHVAAGSFGITASEIAETLVDTTGLNGDAMRGTDGALTDKAGFSLSTAGILAIWHQLTAAIVTASTIGKLLKDNINATISSRHASGAAVASVSGNVDGDVAGNVDGSVGSVAGNVDGSIGSLAGQAKADVLAELNTALDSAISEIAQGVPAKNPNIRTGIMLMYMALRNKLDVATSGTDTLEVHNDAGTRIAQKLLTDAAGDYSEAKMITGA